MTKSLREFTITSRKERNKENIFHLVKGGVKEVSKDYSQGQKVTIFFLAIRSKQTCRMNSRFYLSLS